MTTTTTQTVVSTTPLMDRAKQLENRRAQIIREKAEHAGTIRVVFLDNELANINEELRILHL